MRYNQSVTGAYPATAEVESSLWSVWTGRLIDYLELAKPRISLMALVAVAVGYTVGCQGEWNGLQLGQALLGIALVAVASNSLNQWFERGTDARMRRTMDRPLPSGRLLPAEVFAFGVTCAVLGISYLAMTVNWLTAAVALFTLTMYVGVYTPLKRVTPLCTAVGAIPGALPPVLGWTAAGGSLDAGAFALFAILFLWQFPHFLAIAWLYRRDYAQAGLRMLPQRSVHLPVTGLMAAAYASVLLPISLLPRKISLAGDVYFWMAIILGLGYFVAAYRFGRRETVSRARGLLWSSLVYLPVLLLALTWDHLQLLR